MKYNIKHNNVELYIDMEFAGKSLASFFNAYHISRKMRYLYLTNGYVSYNHKPCTDDCILQKGDVLIISNPPSEIDIPSAPEPCDIVYEDDFVYVAHKPAGIIIHGEPDSLSAMAARYQELNNINVPVRYLHRLDKDTVGLVLFCKFPFFQAWFDAQLKDKHIHRNYYAITKGKAKTKQKFICHYPLARDRHVSGKYRVSPTGKPATTIATCIDKKDGYLLMDCVLETGRTHQIRVHLSHIQHPIVNDPFYGVPSRSFSGMGLWAYQLQFSNPITKEVITVHDFPQDMYAFFPLLQKD